MDYPPGNAAKIMVVLSFHQTAASGFYLNPSDVPDHIKVCERI
jgi:hypothetical protein